MATRKDMIAAGKEAVEKDVQYIYGAKPSNGEFRVYSSSEINNLRNQYGSSLVWPSDSAKAGSLCCDCSGLITKGCGVQLGSQGFKESADECIPVSQIWNDWDNYIGYALWHKGHIGIVSEKRGYYYALEGSADNSVCYPMNRNNWVYALKLSQVDYSEPYAESEDEVKQEDIDKIVEATAKRVREYLVDKRAFNGQCIIEPYGYGAQFYFDGGSKLVKLSHPDQREALYKAFNAQLPTFVMGSEGAPWFSRLMQACGYQTVDEIPSANADLWL